MNVSMMPSVLRRSMKGFCLVGALLFVLAPARAEWQGGVEFADVTVSADGRALVGLKTFPPGSCQYWSWQLQFNAATPGGKNMMAVVLAAKAADRKVSIWYSPSTAQGKTYLDGCNENTMSSLQQVSLL